jgi:hypothetical protein
MVMATYIEDEETSALITRYAELVHTSKTGALRDLLKREIGKMDRRTTAQDRFDRIMQWLGPAPEVTPEEIPRQYYDWLAGDTEQPEISKNLKKELGLRR